MIINRLALMKVVLLVSLSYLVGGCALPSPFIPDNYAGDTAIINDTFDQFGDMNADIYYVESIDGKVIENAIDSTMIAINSETKKAGACWRLSPVGHHRKVPTQPMHITVAGKKLSINKLLRYTSGTLEPVVKGELQFTPEANATYLVKGNLSPEFTGIWLEDGFGNIVSTVIGTINPNRKNTPLSRADIKNSKDGNADSSLRRDLFLSISSGENELFVKEKLGEPDAVGSGRGDGWRGSVSFVTNYFYNNLGTVQFYEKEKPILYVTKIIPIGAEKKDDELADEKPDEKIVLVKKYLADGNSKALLDVAKNILQSGENNQDNLDELAEITWDQRSKTDRDTAEVLSLFCQILGKSNNPRYRLVLGTLKEEGRTRALRKNASRGLQKLPEVNTAEQFEPGKGNSNISRK